MYRLCASAVVCRDQHLASVAKMWVLIPDTALASERRGIGILFRSRQLAGCDFSLNIVLTASGTAPDLAKHSPVIGFLPDTLCQLVTK